MTRRNEALVQAAFFFFPGYIQFAAQIRDAANRIEMTDPRSWTRWHMRGTTEWTEACRAFMHFPKCGRRIAWIPTAEKPRSFLLDISHYSGLAIVLSSSGRQHPMACCG